jgi:hypothetical protein
MAAIQQLDASSVHRLCADQVVIDLASAAKELIENSLDAGSDQIGTIFNELIIVIIVILQRFDSRTMAPKCWKFPIMEMALSQRIMPQWVSSLLFL